MAALILKRTSKVHAFANNVMDRSVPPLSCKLRFGRTPFNYVCDPGYEAEYITRQFKCPPRSEKVFAQRAIVDQEQTTCSHLGDYGVLLLTKSLRFVCEISIKSLGFVMSWLILLCEYCVESGTTA
ncbi:hypothetical protein JTE90_007853 [Oedothorax gibbosus]|uniref:Uncharacterized protein n=1 Tax=Oedothorax gibbosus TaxID=931172 RepID=A0AAV6VHU8_9ARAC|nr:hypothetical protein JTE90_007853 [Oedothorax gibbosus]